MIFDKITRNRKRAGHEGGRYWVRTSDLCRVKAANSAKKYLFRGLRRSE